MCGAMAMALLFLCPDTVVLAIGAHSIGADAPEISGLSNPLFIGSLEWHILKTDKATLSFTLDHTSSIPTYEAGYGLNAATVRLRYELK